MVGSPTEGHLSTDPSANLIDHWSLKPARGLITPLQQAETHGESPGKVIAGQPGTPQMLKQAFMSCYGVLATPRDPNFRWTSHRAPRLQYGA